MLSDVVSVKKIVDGIIYLSSPIVSMAKKPSISFVPNGKNNKTTPRTKLNGNNHRRCNGETPKIITKMIESANTKLAATSGGTTMASLRTCRQTRKNRPKVQTIAMNRINLLIVIVCFFSGFGFATTLRLFKNTPSQDYCSAIPSARRKRTSALL